jgi:hypothetical protein
MMLRTWLNDVDFIDTPIPEPIKKVFQEVIDVLELELDTDLDDKEWDNIIDKKLKLQMFLRKALKQSCPPCLGDCNQGRNCPSR